MAPTPRHSPRRGWTWGGVTGLALLAAAHAAAGEPAGGRADAAGGGANAGAGAAPPLGFWRFEGSDGQVDVGPLDAGGRRREPLPAGPLLFEQALQGLLDATRPGRETLDDVMRRAAARNQADAEAVQRRQFLEQQTQHLENLIRPLLNAELSYARRCCGSLSREHRAEVLKATRQAGRALAERLARVQIDGVENGAQPLDIRLTIHEKVAGALEPRAAKEEFAAFQQEARGRLERRATAARLQIVVKLDQQLGLTSAQRQAVLDDLEADWQPAWLRELQDQGGIVVNNFPPAPDYAASSIEPHLDRLQREQWAVWRKAAGAESFSMGGFDWSELNGLENGQQRFDAWWGP
jgi:hypothetical protein